MSADVYLYDVPAGLSADPWLRDPTAPAVVIFPRDDKPRRHPLPQPVIPVRRKGPIESVSLFSDLTKRYGTDGERIYWEMRDQQKGPFAAGKKYDAAKPRLGVFRRLRKS